MLPGIAAHMHDSYIAGVGSLHAALLGLFTVAQVQGSGEAARGELMRYFAEMLWYPTALLPSQGVRWVAVDEDLAKAALVDGPITLTLLFRFDSAGLVSAGRFKLIDAIRREARFDALGDEQDVVDPNTLDGSTPDDDSVEDDRLRLIFTCCHPVLASEQRFLERRLARWIFSRRPHSQPRCLPETCRSRCRSIQGTRRADSGRVLGR